MISPHKPQNKGPAGKPSPRTAVPLRGLFIDGAWRCNCPDRPPAVKLQTKNHGVNHLRWFYTCQRDQQHRCNFFLWATDAEAREKLVVLSNSRSESFASSSSYTPRTPSKPPNTAQQSSGLLTPQTGRRNTAQTDTRFKTPLASAKARMMAEDTDEFGLDDSVESEMEKLLDSSAQPIRQPDFGVFRKTPRTENITSPGKRKRSDSEGEAGRTTLHDHSQSATLTPTSMATTPGMGRTGPPLLTPTPSRYKNAIPESPIASSSDLTLQVSQILESHDVVVPCKAQDELRDLFNRYDLNTRGIIRGRDISRTALRKKDEQIARLIQRVAHLEAQKELNRTVGRL